MKNSTLAWILGFFFGLIGTLIVYFISKDNIDDEIEAYNIRQALNMSITTIIYVFGSLFLCMFIIGFLLFPIVCIWAFVICIMGIIESEKGRKYNPIGVIEFIK